jgi:hypothetical protein
MTYFYGIRLATKLKCAIVRAPAGMRTTMTPDSTNKPTETFRQLTQCDGSVAIATGLMQRAVHLQLHNTALKLC